MQVFEKLIPEIKKYLVSEYPREGCGLIVDGRFIPCLNVAANTKKEFQISRADQKGQQVKIQAVIHSHPDGLRCPSAADMRGQIEMGIPWGIGRTTTENCEDLFWFGDHVPKLPLKGRPFRHGVTDCYGAIRDWHEVFRNIRLKEIPRDWNWWKTSNTKLYDGFKEAGFRKLTPSENPEIGDLCLMKIHSKVINHAGVLVAPGVILHHLGGGKEYDPSKLSAQEPIGRWQKLTQYWIRLREDYEPK
jgi:proteasome lid subunit RPN8/RPN11